MTPAEMREMAAEAAFSYLEPLTLRNIAAGARDRILALPLPDTTAADDAEAPSAPNVMMCRICGFVIDTRYKAEKPTVDFTMAGRAKKRQPTAADDALEKAREALGETLHWASTRCPCENEKPDPCPLCGASVEVAGDFCLAVEKTIPAKILAFLREALAAILALGEPK